MKLIIDAMGGDNAPLEIVKGALSGQKRWGVDVTLTGDTTAILQALEACGEKTTQCVPPCHSESQPILHFFTINYLLCIIITECHRVLTIFTFKFNLFNSRKKFFCCHNSCYLKSYYIIIYYLS